MAAGDCCCSHTAVSHPCMSMSLLTANVGNRILACSVNFDRQDLLSGRDLCQDRVPFFHQLGPRRFAKTCVRIALIQWSTVASNYYNDLLKEDLAREQRVERNEITREEANDEEKEWADKEWSKRTETIYEKIMIAFAKYQAITFVMRVYEHVADTHLVSKDKLDQLTTDPFSCAQRRAERGAEGQGMVRDMFSVCYSANIIYYLADFSVHYVILTYGFYIYVKRKKELDNETVPPGPLAFTFLKKTTLLAFTRCVAILASSSLGAVGSMLWPGWGTVCGINAGDSIAFSIDGADPSKFS